MFPFHDSTTPTWDRWAVVMQEKRHGIKTLASLCANRAFQAHELVLGMRLGVDWDGLVSVDPIGTEYGFLSFLVDSYGKRITVSSESWFQAHSIAL